ncbi:hypothetical protein MAM1_0004d00535 [Mucor ambiguus]|uniref:Uncharacterized protein n=1 Tax=Mucor ambiguus TaxID=91626 RepID=A0A0C9M4B2_9FUNG|nr:hypothetical protein MAM1_0004d00535 [Mucor ambiguus]
MGPSSTPPSSATRNRSFHQSFIENWIYKTTSSQQEPLEDLHNEQDSDTNSTDLPPWASPNRPTTSWHKPVKSFTLPEVDEVGEKSNGDNNEDPPSFLSDEPLNDEESEQESIVYPLAINEYSVMATSPTNFILQPDDKYDENEQEEDATAEYKTASTTLRSPDVIHREIDLEYERELNELCKPHPAPSFYDNNQDVSQDTITYGEDEVDEGDTQPYNSTDEDTQPYNLDDEDTQPYKPDTPLVVDQQQAPDGLPEIPHDAPKDDFAFLSEFDDSDYVSPLASLNGDNEADNSNAALDTLSPIPQPRDKDEQTEDDLFDDLTESDILQCEQAVALKIKHSARGKRKAESPIPVALKSQIVRLDKKQIRTSVVKKPTTIDDYFLYPTTINSQTEQDIGKESSTPSFTISSSNEDMNKSQEPKRRPRFGLSKHTHTTN